MVWAEFMLSFRTASFACFGCIHAAVVPHPDGLRTRGRDEQSAAAERQEAGAESQQQLLLAHPHAQGAQRELEDIDAVLLELNDKLEELKDAMEQHLSTKNVLQVALGLGLGSRLAQAAFVTFGRSYACTVWEGPTGQYL